MFLADGVQLWGETMKAWWKRVKEWWNPPPKEIVCEGNIIDNSCAPLDGIVIGTMQSLTLPLKVRVLDENEAAYRFEIECNGLHAWIAKADIKGYYWDEETVTGVLLDHQIAKHLTRYQVVEEIK